jgi:formylglycine-generating enzyme required for sulfatase activity
LAETKPAITGTTLPFDKLSPDQFERLCLRLVLAEGYERAQHLGASGSEQVRDFTAWREGQRWAFQCKKVTTFGPRDALQEVQKVASLPEAERPVGLIFLVTCDVSARTRWAALDRCDQEGLACDFWAGTELDEKVQRHPDVVQRFFIRPGAHTPVAPGLPTLERVQAHRAALRKRLEDDACRRWGGMSVYIQEERATLPIEASPYQAGQRGSSQNLLDTLHAAGRLLVLGEPGSGKTMAVERLARELCAGKEPVVPVLVRLAHYDGKPLADWVRSLLQETGHLRVADDRALAALLHEGQARFFFLFDGLDQVPAECRTGLRDELVRWMATCRPHPVIVTSRIQDELWRQVRDEVGQAVVVEPIGEKQARRYLVAHLGPVAGDALYAGMDPRLQEMARLPLMLWLIKEAGKAGESLPGNRGEMYAHFVSRMLRRDTERRRDANIPELIKRQALSDLAWHLGQDGRRLACPRDEAVRALAPQLGEEAGAVVDACARHGLLAGEEAVRFAPHHTVQEHFAALALREQVEREWAAGAWGWLRRTTRRLLTGKPQGLAALAAEDWWAETLVQLAGLIDDPDWLARAVGRANPCLALSCVKEGRAVGNETRLWVEDRSIRLLRSRRTADRRRAVQALARAGSDRAAEPLFEAAADADAEVAGLAVEALTRKGEVARDLVRKALQGTDERLWRAALRCLAARGNDPLWEEIPPEVWEGILGQLMVWVPPGPFLMGSDTARDPEAFDDELPQHTVTLPGYWIGRYPVTVARFKAFVDDSGHKPAVAPDVKGRDDHPVVYVSWGDARAYCDWLAERSGLPVALPTEAQWEKAARGTDGRIYPWGNGWDASQCNSLEGGKRDTTPVGAYSLAGDSPYGCIDVAGNVWEWCQSLYRRYPYDPKDGREKLQDRGRRVIRGGAFDYDQRMVRCACRGWHAPGGRIVYLGFRLVVAPVPSGV